MTSALVFFIFLFIFRAQEIFFNLTILSLFLFFPDAEHNGSRKYNIED
jgi:hypothetical protein